VSRYHLYFLATSLYRGRELENILSPRASIEGGARNFSKSQSLYREGKLGIFPSPRAYIEGGGGVEFEIFRSPKASIEGAKS